MTIQAIYDHGVFRPLEPVTLPDQQVVTVSVPVALQVLRHRPMPYPDEEALEEIETVPVPLKIVKTVEVPMNFIGRRLPQPYPDER